jgi:hypothetical protein
MMITYKVILVTIPVYMVITVTCFYFQAEVSFPEESSNFLRHIGKNLIPLNGAITRGGRSAHSGTDSANLTGYISELMLGISWLMAVEVREL